MNSLEKIGIYLESTRKLALAVKGMNDLSDKIKHQSYQLQYWHGVNEIFSDYDDNLFKEARIAWEEVISLKEESELAYVDILEEDRLGLWTVHQVMKNGIV